MTRSAALAAALAVGVSSASPGGTRPDPVELASGPRLAAPAVLACPRDRLTSYTGMVASYSRAGDRLELTIDTDAGTHERVLLTRPDANALTDALRIDGRPFGAADWARIEVSPGRARTPLGVRAWVCEDGRTPPVVDWHPGLPAGPAGPGDVPPR